jgi:hypothetical protein
MSIRDSAADSIASAGGKSIRYRQPDFLGDQSARDAPSFLR